jgi:hypothetical protein
MVTSGESRLKKSLSAGGREDRASEDTNRAAPEEKFISTQERRRMWSEEWTQSALPKLPEISGWHLCWLSTTNSYDSIDKRMRLGYVPVKSEELPGYEDYRVKSGEHVGYVSCNEMLLFKLPMDIYQEIMVYQHHDRPREESEKIRVQVESLQGQRDSNGRSLVQVEGEGIGSIEKQPNRTPVFSG